MEAMENSDRFENSDMRKELKRQTKSAIKACAISLIATVILLVGLKLEIGFTKYFVFAGYAICLGATGKRLLKLLILPDGR